VGLPPALRTLVKTVEAALGAVAAEMHGPTAFREIEALRQLMVRFRQGGAQKKNRALSSAQRRIASLSLTQQSAVAQAYTLYLELANVCENAYRTHRLRRRGEQSAGQSNLVYVLTAHPTESRSAQNIALLRRLQDHLIESLELARPPRPTVLRHLIHLLWRVGTHRRAKPTVQDEAEQMASMLGDAQLLECVTLHRDGHRLRIRTWVGGDKDGHPGVGPVQTRGSLAASRQRLAQFVANQLEEVAQDATLLANSKLNKALADFRRRLTEVRRLRAGDGVRMRAVAHAHHGLARAYERAAGAEHSALKRLRRLLDLFPALVVPLEMREEAGSFGRGSKIEKMLRAVRDLAAGGSVEGYVRGLVVSMTETADDLLAAESCMRRVFSTPKVPIIALFETPDVLRRSHKILAEVYRAPAWRRMLRARGQRLEVMVGYSDTAKRMGAFASRLAIYDAMRTIGAWAKRARVHVVFFHGSGGSEGRGGGTIAEQAAGWPNHTADVIKMTLQGEMVERTFSTPEILRSQVHKVAHVQNDPPSRVAPSRMARDLADAAEQAYKDFVKRSDFRALLAEATPYLRLDRLAIGSRPSKRAGAGSLDKLRAIPWVLCWTQTRFLLPVWLGLGTAWRQERRRPGAQRRLRQALRQDPLLRGFLRLLGFALEKAEPRLWQAYAEALAPKEASALLRVLDTEWRAARDLAKAASPGGLLADREWLRESIYYRAPMIHPLNLLQIGLLKKKTWGEREQKLFRETVTGIAAGMLTTG
jgi:phosphoenolpyruvate carboxylase